MSLELTFALLMGLNLGLTFMNIPPVLGELMALYRTSYTEISVLMSALLWPHALLQIPAGMITDRLGVRRTQLLSLACMCAGNALPALAPTLAWGVAGRMLTGVGTGFAWLVNLKMLAVCAQGRRVGAYQAFFAGSFSVGSILTYLGMPLAVQGGWRWTFVAPALACLPLLAMLPLLRLTAEGAGRRYLSIRAVLRMPSGWVLGVYHALSYGAMLSVGNWVPALLAEVFADRTAAQLAWGGALLMLVSGVSRLCGAFIIFRTPVLAIAHGSVAALCLVFLGLALLRVPGGVLLLVLLVAWFGSINFGALFHLASRSAGAASATLLGLVNFLGNLGAVLFTLMFGWGKDSFGSFAPGFFALAALAAAALLPGIRTLRDADVRRPAHPSPALGDSACTPEKV
jgi:MFS family permease